MPLANLWSFGVQPGLNQVIKADKAKDSTFLFLVVQVPFRKMEINQLAIRKGNVYFVCFLNQFSNCYMALILELFSTIMQ